MCRAKIFLLSVILALIPTYTSATTASMSSVDQVLGALAEVVKDRAKEVAAHAILTRLTSELCSGYTITFTGPDNDSQKTVLFLGDHLKCRDNDKCTSDVLFVKTCRLIDSKENIQLTDPFFLKTLSRDVVGFATRLSAYKLSNEQFDNLNVEPFANFIHVVMEQAAKGKNDTAAFTRIIDQLVDNYSKGNKNNDQYKALFNEITKRDETKALLTKIDKLLGGKDVTVTNDSKKTDELFKQCFDAGKPFCKWLKTPCSSAGGDTCRTAQLAYRLRPALIELQSNEDPRDRIRRLFFVLQESDVYEDALNSSADFRAFSDPIKTLLINKGYATRIAMNDSFQLIASATAASIHNPKEASEWLNDFYQQMHDKDSDGNWKITTIAGLWSISSLDWSQRNRWSLSTRNLMLSARQLLATLSVFNKNPSDIQRIRDIAQQISSATSCFISNDQSAPSASEMVMHLAEITHQISKIMNDPDHPNQQLENFSTVLDAFTKMLTHAQERNWVAVGFDISDQLREHAEKIENRDKIQNLRGIQFTRTLLAMYQADSVEEAKGIFQSTLQAESSREQRWGNQWTFDIAALLGVRAGKVWQEWSADQSANNSRQLGYGLYVPFGLQIAYEVIGFLIYPIDLGGYVSGTNADKTPDTRAQSALHSGIAVYIRPWDKARTPIVVGASADIKPRFGNNDSKETRYSLFISLEMPLFIIN